METLAQLLTRTISTGAPLYNEGKRKKCYEVYLDAAQYACQQKVVQETASVGPMLEQAVVDAREMGRKRNYRGAAWVLRHAFNEIIDQSKKDKKRKGPKLILPIRESPSSDDAGGGGLKKEEKTARKNQDRVPPRWRGGRSPKRKERVFPQYDKSPRKPSEHNLALKKAPMKPTRPDHEVELETGKPRDAPLGVPAVPETEKILDDASGSLPEGSIESVDLESGAAKQDSSTQALEKPMPLSFVNETTNMERAAFGLALVSVASSVGAIVFDPSALMFATGTLAGVMGPVTYWQQTKLTDARALIEAHNALQNELQMLISAKKQIKKSITELSMALEKLEELQECQKLITASQENSVVVLETQLSINKRVLKNKQINLKGVVLQNIFSVANTHPHRKQVMTEKEKLAVRDKLLDRLTQFGQLEINDVRFKTALSCQCFACVYKVAKNLLGDNVPDEKRIFAIKST